MIRAAVANTDRSFHEFREEEKAVGTIVTARRPEIYINLNRCRPSVETGVDTKVAI